MKPCIEPDARNGSLSNDVYAAGSLVFRFGRGCTYGPRAAKHSMASTGVFAKMMSIAEYHQRVGTRVGYDLVSMSKLMVEETAYFFDGLRSHR